MNVKRFMLLITVLLLMVACGSDDSKETLQEERENFKIHDNIDSVFSVDALSIVWKIEDHIISDEELDKDSLFWFTDYYLTDVDEYESRTIEEQELIKVLSSLIIKVMDGKYDDPASFEQDRERFYKTLELGNDPKY